MDTTQHMVVREQQADGAWRTVCACGWQSPPASHHDALGWVCGRTRQADDWLTQLLRLCDQRAEFTLYRKTMEEGLASLNEEIQALLAAHQATTAEVPGYQVTLVTTRRTTLSPERLLELGVGTETLEQATKVSVSTSVRVIATTA